MTEEQKKIVLWLVQAMLHVLSVHGKCPDCDDHLINAMDFCSVEDKKKLLDFAKALLPDS